MLKASELRIGNFVFVNEEVKRELEEEEYLHCHFSVTKIKDDEVTIYSEKENIHHTEYSVKDLNLTEIIPITLNEEWLLKFGFELTDSKVLKRKTWWNVKVSRIWTVQQLSATTFALRLESDTDFTGKIITEIKQVHQLQNLYHALIGEELGMV